jgi:tetratricopeptide (TPR) repeat protein
VPHQTYSDETAADDGGDSIVGHVKVGGEAGNVAVGRNILQLRVQVGSIGVPAGPLLLIAACVLAIAIVVVVGPLGPDHMSGNFNVAVADFGGLDQASSGSSTSSEAQQLSRWIFGGLVDEYAHLPGGIGLQTQIWHDSLPLRQKRVTIGIARGAASIANRIGAHLVIYGNLVEQSGEAQFVPEFYVADRLRAEVDEVTGEQRLGEPIVVTLPLADPVNGPFASEEATTRATALVYFTIGLIYDLSQNPQGALRVFQEAENRLERWAPRNGKEVLFLYKGRELLALKQEDAAAEAFQHALKINPQYARAHIGLGNVAHSRGLRERQAAEALRQQAQGGDTSAVDGQVQQGFQRALTASDQAATEYRTALGLAQQSDAGLVQLNAQFGLAGELRTRAETYLHEGLEDSASRALPLAEQAVELNVGALQKVAPDEYGRLAYASLGVGAARQLLAHTRLLLYGDIGRKADFLAASAAYADCLNYARLQRGDRAAEDLLKNYCTPYKAAVDEAAAAMP